MKNLQTIFTKGMTETIEDITTAVERCEDRARVRKIQKQGRDYRFEQEEAGCVGNE